MQINYTADALSSLLRLVNFIENKNTDGAGERWLNRFESYLIATLPSSLSISLCSNQTFHKLNLRCIYFNEWVVAFSIENGNVLIEALIHKSRIIN